MDTFLKRDVAIKIIKDAKDHDSIRREIASLSAIHSKHVVQLFDLIQDSRGSIAIVQEYLPGADLSGFSIAAPTLTDYLRALLQIASGIADIHSHSKIHRDIKPINMKFDAEGIIKIFDFGLSCSHHPTPVTTAARGTMVYRAPEMYTPPAAFTQAVDTYAFGITAWEMLTPNFPPSLLELPPQSQTPAPSFATQPINLPGEIVEILDRTLSINPARRPKMREVRQALSKRLLYGQHQGTLTYGTKAYRIIGTNSIVKVQISESAHFSIAYTGLEFVLRNIVGEVYVNNIQAGEDTVLPGSCVLTIPQNEKRAFLTFDISHPEVVY